MVEPVLLELGLLFALCVGVAVLFHRFRLPPIVGFLVAGAIVGPFAVGLVRHEEMVKTLAEVGVVVLLFALGMEVPLGQLARLRRTILVGGSIQVGASVAVTALVAILAGASWQQGVFLGFLLALSSTAASTKVLLDRGEFSTPHGRLVLGIDIAQDLAVVPMIVLLPLLGARPIGHEGATAFDALRNVVVLVAAAFAARLAVPRILDLVARTRSRELFVLTLATLCLSFASVTAFLGLSLALGAFLAGVLLADSDYHGQASAEVEPFRDALASVFFVSIGMLFDWRIVVERPGLVAAGLLGVIGGKAAIVYFATKALGQPKWTRLRAAFALAQVGEFSFVLMSLDAQGLVLGGEAKRAFLVVAVLSIAATPILYAAARAYAARRSGGEAGRAHGRGKAGEDLSDHAIVVGCGPTGRTVAHALEALGLPCVVVEMNAATVKAEKALGMNIVLGDATRTSVLRSLGVERARIVVLAVNDGAAASRIVQLVTKLAPQAHVLARAVYIAEAESLRRAGAHDVVPQELEASIEILVRVLRRFLVADDQIGRLVTAVRDAAGSGPRAAPTSPTDGSRIAEFVPGLGFAVYRVQVGAPVANRSLAEIGIRRRTGCSVVAIRRDGKNLPVVVPETVLLPNDVAVVLGPDHRLPEVAALFLAPSGEPPATETGGPVVRDGTSTDQPVGPAR